MTPGVVLAHDYATQRGGAERVALVIADAFPGSPMHLTLYDPAGTYPEFAHLDLRPSALNHVRWLRQHHRYALPLLAPAVSWQPVRGDVLLASSSGWAHGYRGTRRTVVYCHAPARWLYQRRRYLGRDRGGGGSAAGSALAVLGRPLRAWDRRAARRADVYLANSTVTREAIRAVYGIEAEILPPPPALTPGGPLGGVSGLKPGFLLCVARLLPYKNVDAVIQATRLVGGPELVVVGEGPDRGRLIELIERQAGPSIRLLGSVTDDQLRWLYSSASLLVAASYEDFGLSPLEAARFGAPSVVLRAGGYLDTVVDGTTGLMFDTVRPRLIADSIIAALDRSFEGGVLRAHAEKFGVPRFQRRLQEVVTQLREDV